MDMEKYEELIKAFVPEDEEQSRDYQRAIQSSMRLRYLEIPEVLEDEVYDRMYEEVSKNNDREQVLQFERDYIKQSDYEKQYYELMEILEEVRTKYASQLDREQYNEEYREDLKNKREKLRALKLYWDRTGVHTMRNVNLDTISDSELLGMYERIFNASNISFSALEDHVKRGFDMIAEDKAKEDEKRQEEIRKREEEERLKAEKEREERLAPIRERVRRFAPTPNNVVDEEITVDEVEQSIENFRKTAEKISKHIDLLNGTLVLDVFTDLDISDGIRNLDEEVKALGVDAKGLLEEMDLFDEETKQNGFSMTPSEINKKVEEFKLRLKDLKILQVSKYNARVEYTNEIIRELKAMTGLEPDVEAMIQGLTELDRCNVRITNWTVNSYLKNGSINYNRLVEVDKMISDIRNKLNIAVPTSSVEGLDSDIQFIENRLDEVDALIVDGLSDIEKNQLNQDLDVLMDRVNDFKLKLENNKDNLSVDEYNAYKERIVNAENRVVQLRNKLNKNIVNDNNDYNLLESRTSDIEKEMKNLEFYISGLKGLVSVDVVENVLNVKIVDLKGFIDELKEDIEVSYKDGKIDVNQYNALLDRLKDVEKKLDEARDKLKDPGMIRDADIFAVLNGEIEGLDKALTSLEEQVEKLDKPIKRENRKEIDAIVKHLENEIKRIEKNLEQYKDKAPNKYEESMNKLNSLKDRMEKLGKNYRNKCPLMVKGVKSAKAFFKKHQKKILIIAGLAAFALVSYHVLIPAIMHGNIMIAGTTPAVRPFMKFCNNVLSSVIGATKDEFGMWFLANGVRINPSCAASSLLKGLAVSGIGTTALVAPLVVAIKKLVEKMNTAELKKKLTEEKEKLMKKSSDAKEKVKEGKDKVVDRFNREKGKLTDKNGTKKTVKNAGKSLEELLNKFYASGKSLEEFVKDEELSEEEFIILKHFSEKTYEESGKKKRR